MTNTVASDANPSASSVDDCGRPNRDASRCRARRMNMIPTMSGTTDSAARTVSPAGPQWRVAAVTVAASVLAIIAVFHETAAAIAGVWQASTTFSHGYVIVPVVLGLVWYRRRTLTALQPRPWPWALAGVAGAGMAWLVGAVGDVDSIQHFALAAMIPFTVWSVVGHAVIRALMFPLAYLFFAVPFGEFLIEPLMNLTADMTVGLVRASGIPVYREARLFTLPSGSWSVVEACSGIRYLIASLALGVLYAYLVYRSFWRRALFVVAAAVVPIVANGLRAYMIVMIGHFTNMEYATGIDHLLYGWLFFGIVIFLMFWIGTWWREDRAPSVADTPADTPRGERPRLSSTVLTGLVAVVIAAGWPVYADRVTHNEVEAVPALAAPAISGDWRRIATPPDPWRPDYSAPRTELRQHYALGDARAGLFVGYYHDQLRGAEMVAWNHRIAPTGGDGWRRLGRRQADIAAPAGAAPLESILGRDHDRMLAWHWFWVDGHWTSSRAEVKARLALARLLGRGDASAVVVLHAPFDHSPGEVRDLLHDFAARSLPGLHEQLLQAQHGRTG